MDVSDALTKPLRVVSYGGGVQSTSLLILQAQGRIDYPIFLFANVGDDSEHPATLRYVREVALPFAAEHGIELHELHRQRRDGTTETLMGRLTKPGSRSLPIPIRMSNGAPSTRSCTIDFKIKVIAKWLKAHGASPLQPAHVAVGFSTDEASRATTRKASPYEIPEYPLLAAGINLRRDDCARVIQDAGLPVPPKSACYFCPFHRPQTWREQRRDEPDLFAKSAALEDLLNQRRDMLGKDHVYLTRFAKPLREAISEAQATLFDDNDGPETCGYGTCFT